MGTPAPDVELPELVAAAVETVLSIAATWLAWDGAPRVSDDGERIYTPHKVVRRTADHLLDHLAEIEALCAGSDSLPDGWRGSFTTTPADLAVFTEADLDEARQRLRRLAQIYRLRLAAIPAADWDRPQAGHMSIREIVEHVGSPWYAEQLGRLRPATS